MSQSSWLVAARAPGLARDPLKKLPPDPEQLFNLIDRWREESRRAGRVVRRVCVASRRGATGSEDPIQGQGEGRGDRAAPPMLVAPLLA